MNGLVAGAEGHRVRCRCQMQGWRLDWSRSTRWDVLTGRQLSWQARGVAALVHPGVGCRCQTRAKRRGKEPLKVQVGGGVPRGFDGGQGQLMGQGGRCLGCEAAGVRHRRAHHREHQVEDASCGRLHGAPGRDHWSAGVEHAPTGWLQLRDERKGGG